MQPATSARIVPHSLTARSTQHNAQMVHRMQRYKALYVQHNDNLSMLTHSIPTYPFSGPDQACAEPTQPINSVQQHPSNLNMLTPCHPFSSVGYHKGNNKTEPQPPLHPPLLKPFPSFPPSSSCSVKVLNSKTPLLSRSRAHHRRTLRKRHHRR